MILRDQLPAKRGLIVIWMPRHVINLILGAEIVFWCAMAFQTPLHVKRLRLPGDRHLVDPAVTGRAADAFRDVDAVIEIGEVGQIVDTSPFQGRVGRETGTDGCEQRRFRPQLGVTSHARLGRGNAGERGGFNGSMTITAINSQTGNVVLMTEGHRLIKWHVDVSRVRRPPNSGG